MSNPDNPMIPILDRAKSFARIIERKNIYRNNTLWQNPVISSDDLK